MMTERDYNGIRGAVKLCINTTIYPAVIGPDGKPRPEVKQTVETEYDVKGRVVVTRNQNGDGSVWVLRNSYDVSSRLLKTVYDGQAPWEDLYAYDDQGRLLSITSSTAPSNPITFRYDEHGRKIKTQVSRREDYRSGGAVCGSPFGIADMAPNFPGGGSSTTSYNEEDRPVEAVVRGPKGEIVSRVVCVYDDKGRIIEERATVENVKPALPIKLQKLMVWPHIRRKVNKFFENRKTSSSVLYTYDDQGRLVTRQDSRQLIEFTYNTHGDKMTEITRWIDADALPAGHPSHLETHYDYEYDNAGNWIEERASHRSSPDATLQPAGNRRRELVYY